MSPDPHSITDDSTMAGDPNVRSLSDDLREEDVLAHDSQSSRTKTKTKVETKSRPKNSRRTSRAKSRKRNTMGQTSPMRRACVMSVVEVYRIDPLVALRVSAAFFMCVYLMFVVAAAAMFVGGLLTGLTKGFTDTLESIGWEDVKVNVAQLILGVSLAGGIFVIASALVTAFLVVFYNLISEVVGGIRLTLSDETIAIDEHGVDTNVG